MVFSYSFFYSIKYMSNHLKYEAKIGDLVQYKWTYLWEVSLLTLIWVINSCKFINVLGYSLKVLIFDAPFSFEKSPYHPTIFPLRDYWVGCLPGRMIFKQNHIQISHKCSTGWLIIARWYICKVFWLFQNLRIVIVQGS